jgi:putative ABC transport system permease protein
MFTFVLHAWKSWKSAKIFPEGVPDDSSVHEVNLVAISPAYFRTMRIPLHQGRSFDERDDGKGDVLGIIIDDAAAKLYWRGRDGLGGSLGHATHAGRVA